MMMVMKMVMMKVTTTLTKDDYREDAWCNG